MKRVIAGSMMLLGVLGCSAPSDSPTSPLNIPKSSQFARGPMGVIVRVKSNPRFVAESHGVSPRFVYSHVFKGFAAKVSDTALAGLLRNPNVQSIEPDATATISYSWNLDRINQRFLPLDNSEANERTGLGVHVYVIDSGIRSTHSDFLHIGSGQDFSGLENTDDCIGHGTHVSGTVGGTTYGVAKQVTIHPVRVFGCSDSAPYSTVLAAMDWVAQNATRPAVINMSLGGPQSSSIDSAVASLSSLGITVVVAAGNEGSDACQVSPAGSPEAITVGATDINDYRASFSNWGDCVDLFAPGVSITSAFNTGDDATHVYNGTSMASPHVTGIVALFLENHPNAPASEVQDSVKAYSTKGIVQAAFSVNSNLAFSGQAVDTSTPPPQEEFPQVTNLTATSTRDTQYYPWAYLRWEYAGFSGTTFQIWWRKDGESWKLATNNVGTTDAIPLQVGGIKYWFKVRSVNPFPSEFSDSASVVSCAGNIKSGKCKR